MKIRPQPRIVAASWTCWLLIAAPASSDERKPVSEAERPQAFRKAVGEVQTLARTVTPKWALDEKVKAEPDTPAAVLAMGRSIRRITAALKAARDGSHDDLGPSVAEGFAVMDAAFQAATDLAEDAWGKARAADEKQANDLIRKSRGWRFTAAGAVAQIDLLTELLWRVVEVAPTDVRTAVLSAVQNGVPQIKGTVRVRIEKLLAAAGRQGATEASLDAGDKIRVHCHGDPDPLTHGFKSHEEKQQSVELAVNECREQIRDYEKTLVHVEKPEEADVVMSIFSWRKPPSVLTRGYSIDMFYRLSYAGVRKSVEEPYGMGHPGKKAAFLLDQWLKTYRRTVLGFRR